VRGRLPAAPARVVEIGCGTVGGFVPRLRAVSYDALGVDPRAPDGPEYRQIEFERLEPPEPVDAIVACTSLHHVHDLREIVERIATVLAPDGVLIVVEWSWETFDEPTARWCFERLDAGEESWLHRRRDDWLASGESWDDSLRTWVEEEGLHRGDRMLAALDARFERLTFARGPYCFAALSGVTAADEQAAIDAGTIRAMRLDYVGTPRPSAETAT
jgi:SAM-dependent methyltransferase